MTPKLTLLVLCLHLTALALTCTAVDLPAITSVSGCTDIGNTTTACVRPFTLTLTGTGFLCGYASQAGVSNALIDFTVYPPSTVFGPSQYQPSPVVVPPNKGDLTDTRMTVSVPRGNFGLFAADILLHLEYNSQTWRNGTACRSPPKPLISFSQQPLPELTGITGCASDTDDGRTTLGCTPLVHTFTLSGRHFSQLNESEFSFNIGASSWVIALNTRYNAYTPAPDDYSDTHLVISVDSFYAYVLPVLVYGGAPTPVFFSSPRQYNNWSSPPSVYAQFAPLPRPNVTSLTTACCTDSCQEATDTGVLSNCSSGLSKLTAFGHFLYAPISVTVAGLSGYVQYAGTTELSFQLPLATYDPTQRYDVVISTLGGVLTLSSAVSFTTAPLIASLLPCKDTGYWNFANGGGELGCQDGDTLTLRVAYIDVQHIVNITISSWNPELQPTLLCSNLRAINDTAITCALPQRWVNWTTQFYTSQIDVQVNLVGDEIVTTDAVYLWDFPDRPVITSAVGCSRTDGASSNTLNQCLGGEVVTITGANFDRYNWNIVFERSQGRCTGVVVLNSTTLTCQLPVVEEGGGEVEYDVTYVMNILTPQVRNMRSNAVYVTYVLFMAVDPTPPLTSTTSSVTWVVVGVVLAVVVVAGAVLAVWLRRSRRCDQLTRGSGRATLAPGSASFDAAAAGKAVEMGPWGRVE